MEEPMARHPNTKRKAADPRLIERLVKAEKIAAKENCLARNVAEFETKQPCSMIAEFLGGRDAVISDVVVENAWRKFLKDAGDPTDPIERTLLLQLFFLHHRSLPIYAYMASQGLPGYKVMGGLASKMTRSVMALSATLTEMREKRTIRGDEENSHTKLDADPEAEQAELLAELRERQRRQWRRMRTERNDKSGADFATYQQIKTAHGIAAGLKYSMNWKKTPRTLTRRRRRRRR
jgi:hypothetical protein